MKANDKLTALRTAMKGQGLSAYLQPVHDEYMSEYPPASHRRAQWLTGFTGSAGVAVVLQQKAAFFTDGRYTLQAKNEIDADLYEQHNSANMALETWLAEYLKQGDRVGYDARLYTRDMLKRMQQTLSKKAVELVPVSNLIDPLWNDRPAAPESPLFVHEMPYAGEDAASKRQRIAEAVKTAGAEACIIAAPDAVCWLLNIRARDVENTPLVLAAAIINANASVQLFVAPERCHAEVRAHLGNNVEVINPSQLEAKLAALKGKRVLCDPASAPVWFTQVLSNAGATIVDGQDPCLLPKAMKNPVELQGIRNAHILDGVAVTKLLCWLDEETQKRAVTELDVSDKLLSLRKAHRMFVEPSFNTIAGSGPNGAIVHYRATKESNRVLKQGELFLLDSGGQYPDGTTDITRTVPIGQPTLEHKDRFTRVLKGHIAIATALFPQGTTGSQLDALARQYLWQAGLDYDHGTGHGVGCFLGVHEGPQRISKRGGDAVLRPGMIVSNEPGYYKTGEYGIRLENLVAVTEKSKGENDRVMLGFETITCAPLDTRMVDASQLTATEKEWLNAYHAWVLATLSPALDAHEQAWVKQRCAAI